MQDFIDERWRAIFAFNGLDDFDAIWNLEAECFEPPNTGRGGWSGVARCELRRPEGGSAAIFLKRQQNHAARSLAHPLRGAPTFLREFRRIMAYRDYGIPAPEPVYFAMRAQGGQSRAILATEELTGFVSLEELARAWRAVPPPRAERRRVIEAAAGLLRQMHARRIRHGCFYAKHVFVRARADGSIEARAIDLEKSQWRPRLLCALRDLDSFNRDASPVWSLADRMFFFKRYLDILRLTPAAKRLWRRVAAISARKRARRAV